ncbi:hypothetical protein GXW82_03660 [Streptacidiphilus sp. 4-A2]|nr:hypothetical protein [Streptacidiphilus sp. 4-A2]
MAPAPAADPCPAVLPAHTRHRVLLDRLRPLLWQRLAGTGQDRTGEEIVISTFRAHYRLPVLPTASARSSSAARCRRPEPAEAPEWPQTSCPRCSSARTASRASPACAGRLRRRPRPVPRPLPPLTADLLSFYLPY